VAAVASKTPPAVNGSIPAIAVPFVIEQIV